MTHGPFEATPADGPLPVEARATLRALKDAMVGTLQAEITEILGSEQPNEGLRARFESAGYVWEKGDEWLDGALTGP